MHRTKLPLTVWFWAAHLMATHSNGISALQLVAQLPITYKTAWLLTQKLRRSMVDPDREPLEGVVEIDQTEITFRDTRKFYGPISKTKLRPTHDSPVTTRTRPGCYRFVGPFGGA